MKTLIHLFADKLMPLLVLVATATSALAVESPHLVVAGDSITALANATTGAKAWPSLVASERKVSLINLAYGSAGVTDYAREVYPGFSNQVFRTSSPDMVERGQSFALLAGYNDMRDWGASTNFLAHFERCLSATIGWLAIPSQSLVTGVDPRIVRQGQWVTATNYATPSKAMGLESLELGASLSFEVTGTALYVCVLARSMPAFPFVPGRSGRPLAPASAFRLTVDGTDKGVLPAVGAFGNRKAVNGSDPFNPEALDYAPHLFRWQIPQAGRHAVTLTVVSNNTPATMLWAAGNGVFSERATLPKILLGNTLRMTTEAYRTRSTQGSDDAVNQFHRIIETVANQWFSDGASVADVDLDEFYDPSGGVSSDLVHPNDFGHAAIAAGFLSPKWARFRRPEVYGSGVIVFEVFLEPRARLEVQGTSDLLNWDIRPSTLTNEWVQSFTNVWGGTSSTDCGLDPDLGRPL